MIFMKKPVRNVSLGTVENLGFGRIFYRLNAGMTFELIPHLRIELLEIVDHFKPRKLIFELEQLNRFSGAGLAILVQILRHLPPDAQLYLAHLHKEVRGVIEIAHLDDLVIIIDDLPAAQAAELLAGSSCPVPKECPGCVPPSSSNLPGQRFGGADARGN
jgi:anti-anti-sigma regulatory factor